MSKANTLFSYFKKTSTAKRDDVPVHESERPPVVDANDNVPAKPAKNKVECVGKPTALNSSKGSQPKNKTVESSAKECLLKPGDVVWSKLEGYPWWPSLVCNHPKSASFLRPAGTSRMVHVQFFDEPPTRGWIKEKFIKPFTGSDCKEYQRGYLFTTDPKCRKGVTNAEAALKMDTLDRLNLVVPIESSEEEDEEEDEADLMDVDESNDDDNLSEEDTKENVTPPEKTQNCHTPKRSTRSRGNVSVKRRRIIESDEEHSSGSDEFKLESEEDNSSDENEEELSEVDEVSDNSLEGSEVESPVKIAKKRQSSAKLTESNGVKRKSHVKPSKIAKSATKRKSSPDPEVSDDTCDKENIRTPTNNAVLRTPVVSTATKLKLANFSANEGTPVSTGSSEERNFTYLHFDFLQPNNVRDSHKRYRNDPDYDPKTLFVPDSFLVKQTPAMRQWWEMKRSHYDTVLFFKMGKFYELFHMDATVAVTHLGLIYMKGEYAHSGFPEIAFSRYSDMLIQKGFKIARVEQTETPDMMAERVKELASKSSSKVDKVVRREICSVQTKGTKRLSFIDGDTCDSGSQFLLALCEKVGQFEDDRHGSRLRTLIAHYPPAHVLFERNKISDKTQTVINCNLSTAFKDGLRSGSEFWESGKTLKFLSESDYFIDESDKTVGCRWPEALKELISDSDSLGHTAASGCELAIRSLGAVVWHLKYCLMDQELLSLRSFVKYTPVDLTSADVPSRCNAFYIKNSHMVLDGVTLVNLDVLTNNSTGTTEGTLIECLQHCHTAFGKRLLKQWLCSPLCNPDAVNDRLDAMEDLMNAADVVADVSESLKKLPDLERLLSKIHTLGLANRSKTHPDSRAILFEDITYSKRKIEDFLLTLDGYKTSALVVNKFKDAAPKFRSKLLRQCTISKSQSDEGRFPDISSELAFFDKAFDHQKARNAGVIKPSKGVDPEYDQAVSDIQTTERQLNEYLDRQKKILGCKTLTYWGTGKNRFQMEVPDNAVKNVPNEYEVTSQKKGSRRYRTPEIERLLAELTDAEERRDSAQKDTMRRIFFQFDKHYNLWNMAIECLSVLDVLISLSYYSRHGDGNTMCRPEFVVPTDQVKPFLEIREGRHPCICKTYSGGDFIPNDTIIGLRNSSDGTSEEATVVLVTGPNMGGKSTLMRQVGDIVILAQLGCYVPAEACRLTPVDRIFTRLGATDRIMAGESTFFVELSETAVVLQHASEHSLVLLDELGRGTATHDGNAIACAVVRELCDNLRCRTLFSTHYHSLVEEFASDANVTLGHMACMVENENDDDPSQETITFLYKFISGACPKSYGFNAARLANIPDEVIRLAHKKAKEFEESIKIEKLFRELWNMERTDAKLESSIKDLLSVMS